MSEKAARRLSLRPAHSLRSGALQVRRRFPEDQRKVRGTTAGLPSSTGSRVRASASNMQGRRDAMRAGITCMLEIETDAWKHYASLSSTPNVYQLNQT